MLFFFFLKSENLSVSLRCNPKLVIPGDASVTTAPFDTTTLRLHTHFSHLQPNSQFTPFYFCQAAELAEFSSVLTLTLPPPASLPNVTRIWLFLKIHLLVRAGFNGGHCRDLSGQATGSGP